MTNIQWTFKKTSYLNYDITTSLTTDAQVDVVFSNATSGCTLQVDYVTLPTATGTCTVQAESGGTIFDRGSETGAPGANAFDGVNVINGAELMTETGSLRFVVGLNALAAGYDAKGNMTLRLKDGARYFLAYDAESRLTSVSGTVSTSSCVLRTPRSAPTIISHQFSLWPCESEHPCYNIPQTGASPAPFFYPRQALHVKTLPLPIFPLKNSAFSASLRFSLAFIPNRLHPQYLPSHSW